MAENKNYTSMSEQYVKKSNRRYSFLALCFLQFSALALFAYSGRNQQTLSSTPIDYNVDDFERLSRPNADAATFPRGTAALEVMPSAVSMSNVVLGSNVESVITLTAANAPHLLFGSRIGRTTSGWL